jgi:flagellar hook-associated protein 3 FlgL
MSNIEDVDLASLLTELANQQLSYETVLKSSSMIMKMSLVNYL